jgi:hypothetical protein
MIGPHQPDIDRPALGHGFETRFIETELRVGLQF